MNLYHAHSRELNGFYQSDILVAAPDQATAEDLALTAYEKWIRAYWDEMGFTPTHDARATIYDDSLGDEETDAETQEDFETELRIRLDLMRAELNHRLKPVENNTIIMHRS